MTKAETLKAEGNKAFAKKEYLKAAKLYRDAINLDTLNATLYSNRAQCFIKLEDYERALKDTIHGINLDPDHKLLIKLYYRQGLALHALHRNQQAITSFQRALQLDPNEQLVKAEVTKILKESPTTNENIEIPIREVQDLPQQFNSLLNIESHTQTQTQTPKHEVSERAHTEINELFSKTESNSKTQTNQSNSKTQTNQSNTKIQTTDSPMTHLSALRSVPPEKKIGAYRYVIAASLDDYINTFTSTIELEFLQFYIEAANYISNDIITNWDSQVIKHMQFFSQLGRFKLSLQLIDDKLIQQLLTKFKSQSPTNYNTLYNLLNKS
ncbi:uncharacterized protein RJT21DRAFT_53312 [Scheffersomyces amazonensis]|uniref:uncharacterized protein n=1 Tax=Scheffersomyces amazonensis TaxID=1078765 RepID=UPI00315DE2ED